MYGPSFATIEGRHLGKQGEAHEHYIMYVTAHSLEHAGAVAIFYTLLVAFGAGHRRRPCEKKKEAGHIRQLDVDPALVNLDYARLNNFPGLDITGGQRA
jgi:hypothetical protein